MSWQNLESEYPVPLPHEGLEIHEDCMEAHGRMLRMAAVACKIVDGPVITGSAVSFEDYPRTRAYFELLERTCVTRAESHSPEKRWTVFAADRSRIHLLSHAAAFPSVPSSSSWVHARSNGVAAHLRWEDARRNAHLELIERDALLRSWFGRAQPEPMLLESNSPLFPADYSFLGYRIPTRASQVTVALVHGFPVHEGKRPITLGFGAGQSWEEAAEKARTEAIRKLAFLWNEPLPRACPQPSPCADYHIDYYGFPPNQTLLKRWLSGGPRIDMTGVLKRLSLGEITEGYIDLTPESLQGKISVVKAISNSVLPLTFGVDEELLKIGYSVQSLTHPVA